MYLDIYVLHRNVHIFACCVMHACVLGFTLCAPLGDELSSTVPREDSMG